MTSPIRCLLVFAGLAAIAFGPTGPALRADTPPLLHDAVGNWLAGKEDWAFTQRVRALVNDGRVKEERLERYDPSLPDNQRWHLLEVDGKPPTEAQRKALEVRKNQRPRKHANKPPEDFLDFPHAVALHETPEAVTYAVAVRPEAARLVQTEKLILLVTIGRESHAVERITASLSEPMRVALGLARITDIDLDMHFEPEPDGHNDGNEPDPSGGARVSLSKFGDRMEYEWTAFKRVTPYPMEKK